MGELSPDIKRWTSSPENKVNQSKDTTVRNPRRNAATCINKKSVRHLVYIFEEENILWIASGSEFNDIHQEYIKLEDC